MDSKIYNTKVIAENRIGKNMKETTVQLSRKDNKFTIDYDDIEDILGKMTSKLRKSKTGTKEPKILIRALAIDKWVTLKPYAGELMSQDEVEGYYINRVSNASKFGNFAQLQINILMK